MAGAFTEDNADYLRKAIGRDPSEGELYIAHFLGAGGAAKMISLAESRPTDRAADHFPAAARANRSIFYKGGTASSVQDVYANLVAKHEHTATPAVAARPGASSPRLIEISGEGAPQPIVTPQPVQGGTLFSDLFQPGGRSGLGPAAKSGMGAMSLFSTIDTPRAVAGDSAGAASANASVEETRPVRHAEPGAQIRTGGHARRRRCRSDRCFRRIRAPRFRFQRRGYGFGRGGWHHGEQDRRFRLVPERHRVLLRFWPQRLSGPSLGFCMARRRLLERRIMVNLSLRA